MIRLEYQILAAVMLDLLLGDPQWLPHPVRAMGWLITRLERALRRLMGDTRTAGLVLAIATIAISAGICWAVVYGAGRIHPLAGDVVSILIIASCMAVRDMVGHSRRVQVALAGDDLDAARAFVGRIVSRDADALDAAGVSRAAVESVAENFIDGVAAPLFFAALAGPVGAVAFKAVSTLDSMVGYKNERYLRVGWASAKLDDVANFIPARLTGPVVALAAGVTGGRARRAMAICLRDRGLHSSPNSAWGEAAFAGALGVQLGGPAPYGGKIVEHPTLGDNTEPIGHQHIRKANRLFLAATLVFAAIILGGRVLVIEAIERIGANQ